MFTHHSDIFCRKSKTKKQTKPTDNDFEGDKDGWAIVKHSPSNTSFLVLKRNFSHPSSANCPSPVLVGEKKRNKVVSASARGGGICKGGADGNYLMSHYLLDGASTLPALALAPRCGDRVLDMCAAPGGKSLVLAGQMFPSDGSEALTSTLESNDKSAARRRRLSQVLKEYLPNHIFSQGVAGAKGGVIVRAFECGISRGLKVGIGVGEWGGGLNFDCVLVDAPCSNERHFLAAWAAEAVSGRGKGGGVSRSGGGGSRGGRKGEVGRKGGGAGGKRQGGAGSAVGGGGGGWTKGRLKRDAQVLSLLALLVQKYKY